MEVRLCDIADALQKSDCREAYVDIDEGRVLVLDDVSEDAFFTHAMRLEENWQRFIPLPNMRDVVERSIMQSFAEMQKSDVRARLLTDLAGEGGVARFLRQIKRLLLTDAWKRHEKQMYIACAKDWCEENRVIYRE